MEFRFPFKNLARNDLNGFLSKEMIWNYVLSEENKFGTYNSLEGKINLFKDNLPNFENEILQIVETTNQESIDAYFNDLVDDLEYFFTTITFDTISNYVREWNEVELNLFEQKVEKDTEEYFRQPERNKKHLEEYQDFRNNIIGYLTGELSPYQKVIKTNYNFFCIEERPRYIEPKYVNQYLKFLEGLLKNFMDVCRVYVSKFINRELKAKFEYNEFLKPALFLEGDHDLKYIKKAADLLGYKNVIEKIDIRQRGGFKNLDKLWNFLKDSSIDTVPQKRMLLYDCDTHKINEDIGFLYKRIIPFFDKNPIKKGIENLFPLITITKLQKNSIHFVDVIETNKTERGIKISNISYEFNPDEKSNICNWLCENGVKEDFIHFKVIFNIISESLQIN